MGGNTVESASEEREEGLLQPGWRTEQKSGGVVWEEGRREKKNDDVNVVHGHPPTNQPRMKRKERTKNQGEWTSKEKDVKTTTCVFGFLLVC